MYIQKPYLIFLGDVRIPSFAKTGYGIRDWAPDDCLAQIRLPGCQADLGLPDLDVAAAVKAGARSLLIGVAPVGGKFSESWSATLLESAQAGLDIVSGLHMKLEAVPGLRAAAQRHGVSLIDVRTPPPGLPVGSGMRRSGKRLLTVGTDCALGKKYTALTLTQALRSRGIPVDFRATGQTGILVAGSGIAMDAVVADFVAGAAETLSPDAAPDHWDVIEGQGSLFHPGYAGVTLGLVHGSQPDAIVLCHDPVRTHIVDAPHIEIPPLQTVASRYVEAAQLTNPAVRLVGVSLNTSSLTDGERKRVLADTEEDLEVPCFDPFKTSVADVVTRLLDQYSA